MTKNARTIIFIAAGIVAISMSLTSFYTVDPAEIALVLRFGRYLRQAGPGLHVKVPLGIENCLKVPVKRIFTEHFGTVARRQSFDGDQGSEPAGRYSMVTGDLNIVEVSWSIQYRIVDPVAWAFQVADQQKTIRDTCEAVMSMLIGDRTLADVMGRERDRIERAARDLIESRLTRYHTGVHVATCRLGDVLPPAGDIIASFEDVNKAIQDRAYLSNTGKEEYNRYVPQARGLARQLIFAAEGYAVQRSNRAIGETQRFGPLAVEYERHPEVTRTRLYYEALDQALAGSEGTELVDKKLSGSIFSKDTVEPSPIDLRPAAPSR